MSAASDRAHTGYMIRVPPPILSMRREVIRVLEASERGRPYRGLFYTFLLFMGLVLILDPTRQLQQAEDIRWVWSGFIIAGTSFSVSGVILDRWRIELCGLPLQFSSMLGLIAVLILGGGSTGRLAFAALIAAILMPILHRGVVLGRLMMATQKMVKLQKGQKGAA